MIGIPSGPRCLFGDKDSGSGSVLCSRFILSSWNADNEAGYAKASP